jgi:hypothetical protein
MYHVYMVMDIFDIMISMINHLLYVITIMLIYRIKMIWKMPIILTSSRKHVCIFLSPAYRLPMDRFTIYA